MSIATKGFRVVYLNSKGAIHTGLTDTPNEAVARKAGARYGEVLEVKPVMVVQLISYGLCECILGDEIKVGDVLMFNYGGRAVVVGVLSESKAFRTFDIISLDHGYEGKHYEKKVKRDRPVPYDVEATEQARQAVI